MNLEWIEKETNGLDGINVYNGPESIRKQLSGDGESQRVLPSRVGEGQVPQGSGCSQGACTSLFTLKPGPTASLRV